jgi:hypothetical protein
VLERRQVPKATTAASGCLRSDLCVRECGRAGEGAEPGHAHGFD